MECVFRDLVHLLLQALVLSKYFENADVFPLGFFRNKRVLELGSGTGIVGIVIGMLGRVLL